MTSNETEEIRKLLNILAQDFFIFFQIRVCCAVFYPHCTRAAQICRSEEEFMGKGEQFFLLSFNYFLLKFDIRVNRVRLLDRIACVSLVFPLGLGWVLGLREYLFR